MFDLRYEHVFVAGWVVGVLFLLAGVVAMWVYRAPGTTLSQVVDNPGHSVLFRHAETMRLIRPEKRRLVYGLQLIGTTICVSLIVIPFVLSLLFPGVFD
jgi:hypothetical protein